jgi:hypothetical protein
MHEKVHVEGMATKRHEGSIVTERKGILSYFTPNFGMNDSEIAKLREKEEVHCCAEISS